MIIRIYHLDSARERILVLFTVAGLARKLRSELVTLKAEDDPEDLRRSVIGLIPVISACSSATLDEISLANRLS